MGGPITKRCGFDRARFRRALSLHRAPWGACFVLFVLTQAADLWAAPEAAEPRLKVERGPGAEHCPDGRGVAAEIEHVRGRALSPGEAEHYRVQFEHEGDAFVATVHNEQDGSTRALSDQGPSCQALTRATAVSLALLIDAESSPLAQGVNARAAATDAPTPDVPSPPPAPNEPRVKSTRDDGDVAAAMNSESEADVARSLGVYAGAVLLYGVTRPWAPALSAGVHLSAGIFRAGAGALWAFEGALELGPGHVSTGLRGASIEACVAPARGALARFDLCTGLLAALVRAEASGYSTNESSSRPWIALPLAATLTTATRPVSWQVGAEALLPWHAQRFRVEGVGLAYEAPRVAASMWLRANVELPW